MSARFNDIYDEVRAIIPTLTGFSNLTEIPNPYSLSDNNINFLKNGYGVAIGSSDPNLGLAEFNSFTEGQDFDVILTREIRTTESNPEPLVTVIKELKDLANNLKKRFLNPDQLGIESNIEKVGLGTTSPVTFINAEKFNLATITITFVVDIREQI